MFSQELNPQLDMAEFEATLKEFQEDYNQKHFVRNDGFQVTPTTLSLSPLSLAPLATAD
jgi:magnesium-protoporphyrin IX monomethyl ester (oxidative) cyclase